MPARWPLAACALTLAGCYLSHERVSDASVLDGGPSDLGRGRPDRFVPDAGPRDLGPPDLYRYDGPADCSEVGGFRRCDEACPGLCPDRIRCPEILPICMAQTVSAPDEGCDYVVADPATGFPVGDAYLPAVDCDTHAFPCAQMGSYPAPSSTHGMCVPLAVCLDERPVGFPEFHCTWSDKTLVTGPPPPAACPPDAHPMAPFCGGACERTDCSYNHACTGISNTRGFGVCVETALLITGFESFRSLRRENLDSCRSQNGAPCAYFVPVPQPSELPFGWLVVADACRAYRAIYPANVECRDVDWNLLP